MSKMDVFSFRNSHAITTPTTLYKLLQILAMLAGKYFRPKYVSGTNRLACKHCHAIFLISPFTTLKKLCFCLRMTNKPKQGVRITVLHIKSCQMDRCGNKRKIRETIDWVTTELKASKKAKTMPMFSFYASSEPIKGIFRDSVFISNCDGEANI